MVWVLMLMLSMIGLLIVARIVAHLGKVAMFREVRLGDILHTHLAKRRIAVLLLMRHCGDDVHVVVKRRHRDMRKVFA